jgi:hypothetical protein
MSLQVGIYERVAGVDGLDKWNLYLAISFLKSAPPRLILDSMDEMLRVIQLLPDHDDFLDHQFPQNGVFGTIGVFSLAVTAFALLREPLWREKVRRHAPMTRRTCRRLPVALP